MATADENMIIGETSNRGMATDTPVDTRRTLQTLSVGPLSHDHADKYNQLPDESKEQKHTDNQRHELQPVDIRSLDECRAGFRDEHNEITMTMKDQSIVQHQTALEEKAGNEQQ